eukprot:95112-Amphidinium_carterae.1
MFGGPYTSECRFITESRNEDMEPSNRTVVKVSFKHKTRNSFLIPTQKERVSCFTLPRRTLSLSTRGHSQIQPPQSQIQALARVGGPGQEKTKDETELLLESHPSRLDPRSSFSRSQKRQYGSEGGGR